MDDDFIREPREVRESQDPVRNVTRHTRSGGEEHGGGGTTAHESRLVPRERCDPRAHHGLELGEVDERLRRLAHRVDRLRAHERPAEQRHGRGCVDDRLHAEVAIDLSALGQCSFSLPEGPDGARGGADSGRGLVLGRPHGHVRVALQERLEPLGAWVLEYVAGLPALDDDALIHEDHLVGDLPREEHLVGHDEHGHA